MTAVADPPAPEMLTDVPAAAQFTLPVPVATLSADLMPDEIIVKRRLRYLKRRLVFVMVALVALVVLGDLLVRQQTSSAADGLSAADNHIATLNTQLTKFSKVVTTQGETESIWTQLDTTMTNDVSWLALLDELAKPAPSGMHVAVTAQVDDPNGSTATSTADPSSTLVPDAVGSVTLAGTAPSWSDVAAYVDRLSAVSGFAAVNPSTVSHGSNALGGPSGTDSTGITFTITLALTNGALSQRYRAGNATSTGAASSTPALTFPSTEAGSSAASGSASTAKGSTTFGTATTQHGVRTTRSSASGKTHHPASSRGNAGQTSQESS